MKKTFGCFPDDHDLGTLRMRQAGHPGAPKVEIDYGNSELYTQEDMDAAIQVIEAEFATWEAVNFTAWPTAATRPAATKTLSGSTAGNERAD